MNSLHQEETFWNYISKFMFKSDEIEEQATKMKNIEKNVKKFNGEVSVAKQKLFGISSQFLASSVKE